MVGQGEKSLGITFSQSREPLGFKVDKFEGTPSPSPLKIMGVKEGDVITAVNGEPQQIRDRILEAIRNLQKQGTPIELTVSRGGKSEIVKWTQKLPASSLPSEGKQATSRIGAPAEGQPGERRGGRRGR